MNRMSLKEQKKIMIEILSYFDNICRANNINYSLIGGSLIGAIRHKGIIPWDDDVDVILDKDSYEKVIKILLENNGRYKLLYHKNDSKYFPPFPKLVDTHTIVVEPQLLDSIDNYGVYIDIFCYNNTSNDPRERVKHLKKIKLLNSMLSRKKLDFKNLPISQNIKRFFKNTISKIIGYKKLNVLVEKENNRYNKETTEYVVSNWPIYGIDKEIQNSKNIIKYKNTKFENLEVMIFENYDEILRTTFGNYMELPPEEKRTCHGLEAYWRDNNEE